MPTTEKMIKIGGKSLTICRLSLKGWSSLEGIRKAMDDAVSRKDFDDYFLLLVRFIDTASLPDHKIKWDEIPWFELLEFYAEAIKLNSPSLKFPILDENKIEAKKLPWEYDGRSWYFWLHLFSQNYGWGEGVIGELDIDTAIGLYQEISIDEQLEREWEWGLSENAFVYDKMTKQSKFNPLPRPNWMLPLAPKVLPTVRIRADMLPMGNVIDLQKEIQNKSGI